MNYKLYNYVYQKNLFGTWQFGKIDILVDFIIQKVSRFKVNIIHKTKQLIVRVNNFYPYTFIRHISAQPIY